MKTVASVDEVNTAVAKGYYKMSENEVQQNGNSVWLL